MAILLWGPNTGRVGRRSQYVAVLLSDSMCRVSARAVLHATAFGWGWVDGAPALLFRLQRVSLLQGLLKAHVDCQVFFCDEPTSGLSATDAEAAVRHGGCLTLSLRVLQCSCWQVHEAYVRVLQHSRVRSGWIESSDMTVCRWTGTAFASHTQQQRRSQVIHQPRIEVAKLFDELLLMTSGPGRAVYNGRMEEGAGASLKSVVLSLGNCA